MRIDRKSSGKGCPRPEVGRKHSELLGALGILIDCNGIGTVSEHHIRISGVIFRYINWMVLCDQISFDKGACFADSCHRTFLNSFKKNEFAMQILIEESR